MTSATYETRDICSRRVHNMNPDLKETVLEIFGKAVQQGPLVQCITNFVSM
jgi:hypothetical protein